MNGYWSASVVALAGALVVGALPRLRRYGRLRDAIWLALGLAILANSRPYEGFILGVAAATELIIWLSGARRPLLSIVFRRVVMPMVVILGIAASGDRILLLSRHRKSLSHDLPGQSRTIFASALLPVAGASTGTCLSPSHDARVLQA